MLQIIKDLLHWFNVILWSSQENAGANMYILEGKF